MLRLLGSTFVPLVLLCACGGGGGGGDGTGGGVGDGGLADLSQCLADSFFRLANLSDGFDLLIDEINGIDRPEVSVWESGTGAYVFDADLNDDGVDDTTVSGQVIDVTGTAADGVDVGDEFNAPWNLLNGPTNGLGEFGYNELSAEARKLTGFANLILLNGCTAGFSDIDLTFSKTVSGPPTGSFGFNVDFDGISLMGTVTMNGTSIASVSATLDGTPVNFQIDTDGFTVILP